MPLVGISRSEKAFHIDCFPFLLRTLSGLQSKYLKIFFATWYINFNSTIPGQLLKDEVSIEIRWIFYLLSDFNDKR